jgi:hypothetical protein
VLFQPHVLQQAQRHSVGARLLWLGQTVTQLVVLGLFARYGVRWTRESAAGSIIPRTTRRCCSGSR